MNYNKILQGILDIGEALLKSGAENFRMEDSLYRMCRSYGFLRSDVFVIPSNIQITVETPEGEIITQVRHIESMDLNYDRLDYLNNLCRYVCNHTPDIDEMNEKFQEVMNREEQKIYVKYLAGIMSGAGFGVFFGCDMLDAVLAVFISAMIVFVGNWLGKREKNLFIYNLILAFIAEVVIIVMSRAGFAHHADRIMIGIIMLLISALGVINGIRDFLQRDFISGLLNIMNSVLGAAGIAVGIALALVAFHEYASEGLLIAHNPVVQLISCTIGCTGFAYWFKIRGKEVWYSTIGSFFTWVIYLVAFAIEPSNFVATLTASAFVGVYAFIMSRVNKAPSTIFLSASVFPLMPGARLYYMMYGYVIKDIDLFLECGKVLLETCLAIAFGFIIVDVLSRNLMYYLKKEYHIGKGSIKIIRGK